MGRPPDWRDEKTFLPLQAADMLAWILRRLTVDFVSGTPADSSRVFHILPDLKARLKVPIDHTFLNNAKITCRIDTRPKRQ